MPGLALGISPTFAAKAPAAAPAADPPTFIRFTEASGSYVTCGNPATLNNLAAAQALTIDYYVRLRSAPVATNWAQIAKIDSDDEHGWIVWIGPSTGGHYAADCNVADADGNWYHSVIDVPGIDEWIHVAGVIDFQNLHVGTAVNGAWLVTEMSGDMSDESDAPLTFGAQITVAPGQFANQDIAWIRLSRGLRWTPGTPFTPPAIMPKPAVDAGTYELWLFDEGAGTTAAAEKNTAHNGALHACTWGADE